MTPTLVDLRARPHDRDMLLVHADWLQAQGDPRGELIAIQDLAATTTDSGEFARARARARALVERHAELRPPAAGDANAGSRGVWATWERGFVRRVELLIDSPSPGSGREEFSAGPTGWAELLAALVGHPSMALLEYLLIRVDLRGEPLDETVIALDVALRGLRRWRAAAGPRPRLQLDLWSGRVPLHAARQRLRDDLPELSPMWFSTDATIFPPPAGHPVSAFDRALRDIGPGVQGPFELLWLDAKGQALARREGLPSEWQVHVRRLAELRSAALFSADPLPERRVAVLLDGLAARVDAGGLSPRLAPPLESLPSIDAATCIEGLSPALVREAASTLGSVPELAWYRVDEPHGHSRWSAAIGLGATQLFVLAALG